MKKFVKNRASIGICVLSLLVSNCGRNKQDLSEIKATPCGAVVGSFNGVDAYSNGGYTGTGNSCAGEGGKYGYLYQCVELVDRYFVTKFGGPKLYCNAQDCLSVASRTDNYQTYENGGNVVALPGDAIVFSGGSYGHIVLITEVGNDHIKFLQQNTASAFDSVTFDGSNIGGWGGMKAVGIIHHNKNSMSTDEVPVTAQEQTPPSSTMPTEPQSQNNETTDLNQDPASNNKDSKSCTHLTVNASEGLNVRSKPSKSGKIVTKLPGYSLVTASGAPVEGSLVEDPALGSSVFWYPISEPVEGFVTALYLQCAR